MRGENEPEALGGGAFLHKVSGDALVLVYFSNAATLGGQTNAGRESFDFDLQVPDAGWYWLRFVENSKTRYSIVLYDGPQDEIEFAVVLDRAISL